MDSSRAIASLTTRQLEILELVARGLTNADIGRVLHISPGTVRTHITAIHRKLGVSNRTEATGLFAQALAEPPRIEAILARPEIAVVQLDAPVTPDGFAANVAFGLTEDLALLFSRWTWFPVVRLNESTLNSAPHRYLVRGGVCTQGDVVHLSLRLESGADGAVLWAMRETVAADEVFACLREVASAMVAQCYPNLLRAAGQTARQTQQDAPPAAWQAVYCGLSHLEAREEQANRRALHYFDQALASEPSHLPALLGRGIGQYFAALNQWQGATSPQQLEQTVAQCLQLAPENADCHYLAARAHMLRHQYDQANASLRTAIAINPSSGRSHALLGQTLLLSGASDEGLYWMQHAERLGPGCYVAGLAVACFCAKDYAGALAAAQSTLVARPRYAFALLLSASSAWWLGDFDRARTYREQVQAVAPHLSLDRFTEQFGRGDAVQRLVHGLTASS